MNGSSEAASPSRGGMGVRMVAGLALFGLWVLLSGKLDAFHLGVGLVSVFAVLWMHFRLPPIESAGHPLLKPLTFIRYFFWLLGQMLLSSVQVIRVVLRPDKNPPDPRLIAFESRQPSLVQSVLLANSITLTPGTLTLDYQDGRYLVHALTADTAADLLSGDMAHRVALLSGPADRASLLECSPEDWRIAP